MRVSIVSRSLVCILIWLGIALPSAFGQAAIFPEDEIDGVAPTEQVLGSGAVDAIFDLHVQVLPAATIGDPSSDRSQFFHIHFGSSPRNNLMGSVRAFGGTTDYLTIVPETISFVEKSETLLLSVLQIGVLAYA